MPVQGWDNLSAGGLDAVWYQALADLSPVGIFLTDPGGACRYVNQRWCAIAGMSPEQALGEGWVEGLHPEDRSLVCRLWNEAVAADRPFHAEYRFQTPTGQTTWVIGNAHSVRGADGALLGYIGTITDITASKLRMMELEDARERVRRTIRQLPLMLWAFDQQGKLCAWNREFERVTGYASKEMIGNPRAMEYLFPERRYRRKMLLNLRDRGDEFHNWEWELKAKDGSIKTISWSSMTRYAPVEGWANWGVGFDVTLRKKAEQALQERVKELNCLYRLSHLAKQRHLSIEQFLEQAVHLLPPAWQYPEVTVGRIAYLDQEYVTAAFQVTPWRQGSDLLVRGHKAGVIEVFYLTPQPILDEGPFLHEERQLIDGLALQIADFISSRLDESDQALLRELSAKAEELEHFSHTISHDLKTPMTAIGGFSQYLLQQLDDGRLAGARASAERVVAIIEQMNRRLDELLKLAQIGKTVDLSERLKVGEVVAETLEMMRQRLAAANISVEVQEPLPVVVGDRERLCEVFENLLDNAIKYRDAERQAWVKIGIRQEGGETVFFVQDNGIGIAPDHFDTIFELFRRLDTSVPGDGTGLAIVKRIVEAHGGRIWVESAGRGEGASFCFTLGNDLSP